LGPRPWPSTARIAPHVGGWRRIPCSESNRPRINAADTLSQWVLSSTQLALLHQFRQIRKSGGFARSEYGGRGDRNGRKSRAGRRRKNRRMTFRVAATAPANPGRGQDAGRRAWG
jgi:hypothetical protein